MAEAQSGVTQLDLYWIPLGAGARVVRTSGRIYEAVAAFVQRRPRCSLFHSALVAHTPGGTYFIEMTPVPSVADDRGVVGGGAVGSRLLGRLRIFRYEIRRWRDGTIPDLSYAVASPVRISNDGDAIREVLGFVAQVPTPVWGRDELHAGEMWNSNSVVSWVLGRAGLLEAAGLPPGRGRAPGWDAGVEVASRIEAAMSGRDARTRPSPASAPPCRTAAAWNAGT